MAVLSSKTTSGELSFDKYVKNNSKWEDLELEIERNILATFYDEHNNDSTFDIITWNIEFFPKQYFTIGKVHEIINTLEVDIIALQEIASHNKFSESGVRTKISTNLQSFLYQATKIFVVSSNAAKSYF